VTLGLALAVNVVHYWLLRIRGPLTLEQRALWLRSACRRVTAGMGIRWRVAGSLPAQGLVVSNHLSYLDILVHGALIPCFFVSKIEVRSWLYFGWAARTGAAMFLDRQKRASATAVAQEMAKRLDLPVPIVLFPEGTSTDGSQLLRFHSSLFEPAVAAQAPVTAAAIRYEMEGGGDERGLCWFGDTLFLPHLWKALGTRGFLAEVRFGEPQVFADRRTAAKATHDEIEAMRSRTAPPRGSEPLPSPQPPI
jgi:1-acyl-sn-glycerol-3-phosphate acyltransferase